MNNTILRNNNSNVNDFHEVFLNLVNEAEKDDDREYQKYLYFQEQLKPLSNLCPKILYGYVLHIIKTQFNNDPLAYIETIPLFFENFTKKDRLICDEAIANEDKNKNKQYKRKKKNLLLWAAQLLKLMGGKGDFFRSKILCNSLTEYYKEEMQRTDDFISQHRLVRSNGQVLKLVKQSEKQKQKIAQILKISSVLSRVAQDKGFTYSLCTVTLPPCFHPNPTRSDKNSYNGATPKEAQHEIMKLWKRIRAQLAKRGFIVGENYFGLEVIECQADSTLHLHAVLYHSKFDTVEIHSAINSVAENYNKEADGDITRMIRNKKKEHKFDIRLNDGRASGATYVFKYITKTHSPYDSDDSNAIKNMACRALYGVRSFAFFGIKNSLTQFNFLVTNHITYKKYFSKEIRTMFVSGDYYTFITKFKQYFENVYCEIDGKKKFLGVTFDTSGSKDMKSKLKDKYLSKCTTQVFIEKKQYCIFELAATEDQEIDSIDGLDLSKFSNKGANFAYELVQQKQELYNNEKYKFIDDCDKRGISILEVVEEFYYSRKSNYAVNFLCNEKSQSKATATPDKVVQLHLNNLIQEKTVLPNNPKIEKSKIHSKIEEKTKINIKYQDFKLKR